MRVRQKVSFASEWLSIPDIARAKNIRKIQINMTQIEIMRNVPASDLVLRYI